MKKLESIDANDAANAAVVAELRKIRREEGIVLNFLFRIV